MNALLPNIRWIGIPSEDLGHDWPIKTQDIDRELYREGFDLSEESVFLLFSTVPEKILEGEGQCLIARSVIGPKKNLDNPFVLLDWKAAPIWLESLQGETLKELLKDAREKRKTALKHMPKLLESFTLKVTKKLLPELVIETEVIFNE